MLDLLYGQAAAARRRWFERHPEARRRLRHPVISVGNLSVGGTGKTPLVAQIAEWLIARGERAAILSRGYKRPLTADGVTVVSDGHSILSDYEQAGDEPLMLARQVPGSVVCVAEDRYLAGVIAERVLGASAHVLDDGFQHVQLARDFDVLVTSAGEIRNGRVVPRGRLRERAEAAARAHFAVIVGADSAAARAEAWELGVSAYSAARRVLTVDAASPAIAVAGIGSPEQFFAMIRGAGVDLRETLALSDHHRYTSADIARIERLRTQARAETVVTTAKDAVKFEAFSDLPFPVVTAQMRLELDDWNALAISIDQVVATRRAAA